MDRRNPGNRTSQTRFVTSMGVITLALMAWGFQLVAFVRADGSDVAQKLGQMSSIVGGLSGSVANGGDYSDEENAGAVPFLGGGPGSLVPGVFNALGSLSGFNGFTPADDAFVKAIDDKVNQVDASLTGDNNFPDRVYMCGATACKLDTSQPDASKVASLTSVDLRLSVGSSASGDINFTSLNLPSIGFIPKDAQKLHVDLSWSMNVRLIADANGLRLAPVASAPELDLGASISLPTSAFKIDLGALVVEATTPTPQDKPTFSGHLLVNVRNNGDISFSFGNGSGFKAKWHLETKDSPIDGVEGDLVIEWTLPGGTGAVNKDGLKITVENVKIDTTKLVGDDLQEAAAALREVTHPSGPSRRHSRAHPRPDRHIRDV